MAIICKKCGQELEEGTKFCMACGEKVEMESIPQPVQPQPQPRPQQPVQPQPQPRPQQPVKPDKTTKVVGMGAYFGMILLFSIPIVGLIACLIMAFAPKNKNIKNFSRAMLVWLLIGIVIGGIVIALIVQTVKSITNTVSEYIESLGSVTEILDSLNEVGDFTQSLETFGEGSDSTETLEELESLLEQYGNGELSDTLNQLDNPEVEEALNQLEGLLNQ